MLTLPAPLVPGAFTMSLHTSEVAALILVKPRAQTADGPRTVLHDKWLHRQQRRTVGGERRVSPSPPGEPMTTRKRRRSKVDPFADQLGEVPDTEIAKLAGVTPENVRAYRKRRGIPAKWRGEGQGDAKAMRTPTRAKRAKGGKRRKTKLEPYLDQLGVLPDTEVAELAGVTVGNVRAYRYRHGIPSARQAAKDEDGQPDRPAAPTPAPMPQSKIKPSRSNNAPPHALPSKCAVGSYPMQLLGRV